MLRRSVESVEQLVDEEWWLEPYGRMLLQFYRQIPKSQ